MQPIFAVHTTIWQKTVGLFVTWQLLFLVLVNLLAFLPLAEADDDELTDARAGSTRTDEQAERHKALEFINDGLLTYARATGQIQAWWLFAPSFPEESTFPLVTLHWAQGQQKDVRLYCSQEPEDPTYYVRLPGSRDRLFHYEMRLGLVDIGLRDETLEQYRPIWRDVYQTRVRRQWKSIRAYVRWRAETFAKEHPDLRSPDEITLAFRVYPTPAHNISPLKWEAPLELPLARYRPALDGRTDYLPVEYFDPIQNRFCLLDLKE
jgi:hypothetical protein